MKDFIKGQLTKIMSAERSPHRLAYSTAAGIAISFSPFLGIQTILVLVLGFLLRFNIVVAMAVAYLVNNPLTMFPILAFDYVAGVWFSKNILRLHIAAGEGCVGWLCDKLAWALGKCGIVEIDIWGFFIGGTIVAILIGMLSYPIVRFLYSRVSKKFSR